MIHLYYSWYSICSEKVLVCLFEKSLPFTGVENVFADIDVKRGLGFPMKGTQPPHLGLATHSATFPMEPIELLQQEILREPWLILAPGHLFCLLGIQ